MVTLIFNTVDQTKPIPIQKTKFYKNQNFSEIKTESETETEIETETETKTETDNLYLRCVTSSVVTATARTNLIRKPSNRNKKQILMKIG
jgi:hypothetical protein